MPRFLKNWHLISMNIIGPNVRRLRKKDNMTQEQLVAKCNLLGWSLSRGALAKIESKVRRVTDHEVLLFSKALKVKVTELFQQ